MAVTDRLLYIYHLRDSFAVNGDLILMCKLWLRQELPLEWSRQKRLQLKAQLQKLKPCVAFPRSLAWITGQTLLHKNQPAWRCWKWSTGQNLPFLVVRVFFIKSTNNSPSNGLKTWHLSWITGFWNSMSWRCKLNARKCFWPNGHHFMDAYLYIV